MIPADKSPLFEAWFSRVVLGRLRGAFTSLRVAGAAHVVDARRTHPVLLVGNHTSYWDALVMFHCALAWRLDGFAMMDARNLRRLPFFGKIGAFGVDLESPLDGARALRYAARLLDRPARTVVVFPQGRERPVTARPLDFRAGSGALATMAPDAQVIPFALRYELGESERPDAWVRVGAPLAPATSPRAATIAQEQAVEALLNAIDRTLVHGEGRSDYVAEIEAPRAGDDLATQALAWLTRR
jgi:1-acyl-sn-glycerol-3-phosphate acyltransferase